MARRVTFSEDGARRIVNAVRGYERGNRDQQGVTFRPGQDDAVRVGTVTGPWGKGTTKSVTALKPDGTGIADPDTFEAVNLFANLEGNTIRKVCCASAGTFWVLIAAEC